MSNKISTVFIFVALAIPTPVQVSWWLALSINVMLIICGLFGYTEWLKSALPEDGR